MALHALAVGRGEAEVGGQHRGLRGLRQERSAPLGLVLGDDQVILAGGVVGQPREEADLLVAEATAELRETLRGGSAAHDHQPCRHILKVTRRTAALRQVEPGHPDQEPDDDEQPRAQGLPAVQAVLGVDAAPGEQHAAAQPAREAEQGQEGPAHRRRLVARQEREVPGLALRPTSWPGRASALSVLAISAAMRWLAAGSRSANGT